MPPQLSPAPFRAGILRQNPLSSRDPFPPVCVEGNWAFTSPSKQRAGNLIAEPGAASAVAVGRSVGKDPGRVAAAGVVGKWSERLRKATVLELPGIFAEIQALKDRDGNRMALRLLCSRWAELDAPGGLAFFLAASGVPGIANAGELPRAGLRKLVGSCGRMQGIRIREAGGGGHSFLLRGCNPPAVSEGKFPFLPPF